MAVGFLKCTWSLGSSVNAVDWCRRVVSKFENVGTGNLLDRNKTLKVIESKICFVFLHISKCNKPNSCLPVWLGRRRLRPGWCKSVCVYRSILRLKLLVVRLCERSTRTVRGRFFGLSPSIDQKVEGRWTTQVLYAAKIGFWFYSLVGNDFTRNYKISLYRSQNGYKL